VQSIPGTASYQAIRFRRLISLNCGIDLGHGVFKFVFGYHWRGWTTLNATVILPQHDEYLRFLSATWPYYVGAIRLSVGGCYV
jgi:hypothetical protein